MSAKNYQNRTMFSKVIAGTGQAAEGAGLFLKHSVKGMCILSGNANGRQLFLRRSPKPNGNLNPDPDLLNPKSIGFDRLPRNTTVPSFTSFRSGVFVLSC